MIFYNSHYLFFIRKESILSKWTKFRDTVLKPTAGAVAGFLVGGPVGLAIGAYAGLQMNEAHAQQQANKANLRIQQQALAQQTAELERQRKLEIEQRKRENEQLMNSVSNLTNTSYSGVSSPSIDYDKYGDLG